MMEMVDSDGFGGLIVVLGVIAVSFVIQMIRERQRRAALIALSSQPESSQPEDLPAAETTGAAPEQVRAKLQSDVVVGVAVDASGSIRASSSFRPFALAVPLLIG